jgi:hypothetical protein
MVPSQLGYEIIIKLNYYLSFDRIENKIIKLIYFVKNSWTVCPLFGDHYSAVLSTV